ncbi:hypothetical protein U1Q18_005759, partial [Sarracenia purpurea var. burkii]
SFDGDGGVSSTSNGPVVLSISVSGEVVGARKLIGVEDFGEEEESQSSRFARAKKKVRSNDPRSSEREVDEGLR